MQAIHTRYIPATNTKGSRIKAYTTSGFSATIPYPHEYDGVRTYFEAVKALVAKHNLDWDISNMRWGDGADSKGYTSYTFCFDASKVPA